MVATASTESCYGSLESATSHATTRGRLSPRRARVASLFGDGQALAEGRRYVRELVETRQSLRRVSPTHVNQHHDQQGQED